MATRKSSRRVRRRTQPGRRPRPTVRRVLLIGWVSLALVLVGVVVLRRGRAPDIGPLTGADPTNARAVMLGKARYTTRCASCHGADLQGDPAWPQRAPNGVMPASPLDARGRAWQYDDRWLFRTIKEGGQATAPPGSTSSMPAFGNGLTDEEIWAVLAYIKSTWPADIQRAQPRVAP